MWHFVLLSFALHGHAMGYVGITWETNVNNIFHLVVPVPVRVVRIRGHARRDQFAIKFQLLGIFMAKTAANKTEKEI